MRLQAILDDVKCVPPPTLPLGSRFGICLLLDYPSSTSAVTADDLGRWGVSFDEALGLALKNLQKRSEVGVFQEIVTGLQEEPRPSSGLPLVKRGSDWVDLVLPRARR